MTIVALRIHNTAYEEIYINQTLDWAMSDSTDAITAILCTSTYTPADTHATYSDITNECADADYSPQEIITRTVTRNNDQIRYGSARVDWGSNVTISARYIVLIVGDPAALLAGDRVIGHIDLGATKSAVVDTDNSSFAFTPATSGWWNVDRAIA